MFITSSISDGGLLLLFVFICGYKFMSGFTCFKPEGHCLVFPKVGFLERDSFRLCVEMLQFSMVIWVAVEVWLGDFVSFSALRMSGHCPLAPVILL